MNVVAHTTDMHSVKAIAGLYINDKNIISCYFTWALRKWHKYIEDVQVQVLKILFGLDGEKEEGAGG
jgi:hypothetical protein